MAYVPTGNSLESVLAEFPRDRAGRDMAWARTTAASGLRTGSCARGRG